MPCRRWGQQLKIKYRESSQEAILHSRCVISTVPPSAAPDTATSWCQHADVITHCPPHMSPAIVSETPHCVCIMYDSMYSHSSSVVTAYRWRRGACFRNDTCSTGASWGCQRRQRESVRRACYCWLSRDVFNVSTCQAAICHTLSSHSIIRPGTPDGITYDKVDTLPGAAESLELWDDM